MVNRTVRCIDREPNVASSDGNTAKDVTITSGACWSREGGIITDVGKSVFSKRRSRCPKEVDCFQTGAIPEGLQTNTGYFVRYRNTGQAGAIPEGILTNTGDAVWYCDTPQSGTTIKKII